MKTILTIVAVILLTLLLVTIIGLVKTGASIGWGPFSFLYWPREVKRVLRENPYEDNQNGIVFYGASNFRLWREMKDDLKPYKVANCGFGGSTDKMLIEKVDVLLYPYNPKTVFIQTGSNDYVGMIGSAKEIADKVLENKKKMYSTFHENLKDAHFYIMAGILMPGRSEFRPIIEKINENLKEYCESTEYLTFVNSESLTYRNGEYIRDYFIRDGIHLTHEARLEWAKDFILPELNKIQ